MGILKIPNFAKLRVPQYCDLSKFSHMNFNQKVHKSNVVNLKKHLQDRIVSSIWRPFDIDFLGFSGWK
jgi:hypothetical protein